jgi:hypothetical protein
MGIRYHARGENVHLGIHFPRIVGAEVPDVSLQIPAGEAAVPIEVNRFLKVRHHPPGPRVRQGISSWRDRGLNLQRTSGGTTRHPSWADKKM